MIAKQRIGRGFGGVCRYVLDKSIEVGEEGSRIVDSNMAGQTARELAREFGALRDLAPGCGKPVAHIAVRWAPEDHISAEAAVPQARELLRGLGYTDVPYFMALHQTQGADGAPDRHLHIVSSRIRFDGGVVSTHDNYRRGAQICRELEREHGLVRADAPERARSPQVRLTKDELHRAERLGELPAKLVLAERIRWARERCEGTWEGLRAELDQVGVTTHPVISRRTGEQAGMRYALAGKDTPTVMVDGRAIAHEYGYRALSEWLAQGRGEART